MPSPRRATFGQDVFDNLKAMFEQAPAAPPEEEPSEYSKLELVRRLAPSIGALAKRGWSWKSLAAMMTQRGVTISADLLARGRFLLGGNGAKPQGRRPAASSHDAAGASARGPVPQHVNYRDKARAASPLTIR
ncbi:MAG: hypothetical protein ABSC94_30205 [Polyangiaceae bacterium]